jgi:hypothetical protein
MSSMSSGGGSSGTGGNGGKLQEIYDRIRRLDPEQTPEDLVEKIKQILPSHWTFTEEETMEGTLLKGVKDEGILVTEEGDVFAGRVVGATILNPIRLLGR